MLTAARQARPVGLLTLLFLMAVVTSALPAAAVDPTCEVVNPLTGKCDITIPVPPSGSGTVIPVGNPNSGGTPSCQRFGAPLPCSDPTYGWWSNSLQCYLKRSEPQPPASSTLWQGHYPDGAIYDCVDPVPGPYSGGGTFWLGGRPPGAPATPAQAASDVVRRMSLRAAQIGIVPESKPGSIGAVGAPVYMWTTPGPATFGPQSLTGSAAGITITATAHVDRIVWNMGDGHAVTCRTPGTVYQDRYGFKMSPDCGYRYTRTSARQPGSAYTVTATSYWLVNWVGPAGSSGQIPLVLSSNTRIQIGELQALVTR